MKFLFSALLALASTAEAGTYLTQKEYANSNACNLVASFLVRIANRAGVSATYQCFTTSSGWHRAQIETNGSAGAGSITYYPPVCMPGDGFPFVPEASNFINHMGAIVQDASVDYIIGGPAFCAPGGFNQIYMSWN